MSLVKYPGLIGYMVKRDMPQLTGTKVEQLYARDKVCLEGGMLRIEQRAFSLDQRKENSMGDAFGIRCHA